MKALAWLACLMLVGCQPPTPPPNPFPTKENTIDRVKSQVDQAMKKAEAVRNAADAADTTQEPTKKVD